MTSSFQLNEILREWMDVFMTRSMRDWMRFVKASGFSMPQFNILMTLYYRHSCGVSDISERMDISPAAASQLVEKLVQSGLLERAEDPGDRRAKLLTLTASGSALIESGIEARSHWLNELAATLTPEELEIAAEGLNTLTLAVSKLEVKKTKNRN